MMGEAGVIISMREGRASSPPTMLPPVAVRKMQIGAAIALNDLDRQFFQDAAGRDPGFIRRTTLA